MEKRPLPGPVIALDRPRIRYSELSGVYPVGDDSLLLLETVLQFLEGSSRGRYLDMGCGAGLCSAAADLAGWGVCSADRNPRALSLTRHNLELNGSLSRLFMSDLFKGIPTSFNGYFDLISFNPPYLPYDPDPPLPLDRAYLFGGRIGYEIGAEFLLEGARFISKEGTILLVAPGKAEEFLMRAASAVKMDLTIVMSAAGSDEGLRAFSAHPRKSA